MQDKARERSIDNLQRLYTVVVSLAITEALRRLLSTFGESGAMPDLPAVVAVVGLLFTIVPFYHGANRYLDATYVMHQRKAKAGALMLDFVVIFIEALSFFILSIIIQNSTFFFTILAFLFILDAAWVGLTKLIATEEPTKSPPYSYWALVNFLAATAMLVSIWSNFFNYPFWQSETVKVLALGGIAVARSLFDYISVWNFYYPAPAETGYVMPVPRPAPVPAGAESPSEKIG